MLVNRIHLKGYRNFENIDIELNRNLNIFIGDNAQGKTNLLESIFVSSIGKSFRFSKDESLIRWGEEEALIQVDYSRDDGQKIIDVAIQRDSKKSIKTNGLTVEKNSDLVGMTNIVVFSPDSLNLVKGSPSERRRYLNVELSQLKPNYKYLLTRYTKILLQRNNLLKKMAEKPQNRHLMPVWNEHLVVSGTELIFYRLEYLKKIMFFSEKIHDRITGGTEKLTLQYKSSLGKINDLTKEEIKKAYYEKINKGLDREIIRKSTLYGPHLDDIDILINGMDSKYFSSQGQKRTAALSLILAEIDVIYEEKNEYPVLLLDDVLSELDNKRKSYLIEFIDSIQTIITSTDDSDLLEILKNKEKKIFYLKNGEIIRIIE